MRKSLFVIAIMAVSTVAFAQASGGAKSQSSSNPNATQIQGNTEIKASGENVNAVAVGEGNTAKNAVGAIKGGTQIQGNTKIQAKAKNVSAVASGKNNKACNDIGTVGGGECK